jgi:hypothetical protein
MGKVKKPNNYFYDKSLKDEYESSLWGTYENTDNLPIKNGEPDNLVDYFKYCEDVGLQVELTDNFIIDKRSLSGGVDLLYDIDNPRDGKREGLYGCLSDALLNSSWTQFQNAGHHFWTHKWMAQDFLERDVVIPLNVAMWRTENWIDKFKGKMFKGKDKFDQVEDDYRYHWGFYSAFTLHKIEDTREKDGFCYKKDGYNETFSKFAYSIHPGGGKINVLNFLGINKVPAIITTWKSDNISFGGKLMKTVDDYVELIMEISRHYGTFLCQDADNNGKIEFVKNPSDISNFKKVNIYSKGNYKIKSYLEDPPVCYGEVLANTFPFKVYIGTNSEKDFVRCKEKILNNDDRNQFMKSTSYKDYHKYGWDLKTDNAPLFIPEFEMIDPVDKFDVPKFNNYGGFSVYIDSNIKWDRDIFELLFFGHSKKAFSRFEDNDDIILFNCQYLGWKYTTKDKFVEDDILKLPEHYLKSRFDNES